MNEEYIKQIEEYQKAVDITMSEKMDLEHNWNELKWWLKKTLEYEQPSINTILDKMQELEEGWNNDNN